MFDPASVRIRGPLRAYAAGFWADLLRQGYAATSARNLLFLTAHLARWLEAEGLALRDLTEERAGAFLRHRRRQGYTGFRTRRGLEPLLRYLRALGAIDDPGPPVDDSPLGVLLQEYADYLHAERGLARSTIGAHTTFAKGFALSERPRLDWHHLTARDVANYIQRRFRHASIPGCKLAVSELRSLLRFMYVQGRTPHDFTSAVPAVAGWRLSGLPPAHGPGQGASRGSSSAAARRRASGGCVPSAGPASREDEEPLRAQPCAVHADPPGRGQPSRGDRAATGRDRSGRCAPPSSHRGDRAPPRRRVVAGDRARPAAPPHRHHRDLRQGRHPLACGTRPAVARGGAMSHADLLRSAQEYLALRRALGFKLYAETWLLPDFVAFLTAHGSPFITTELAVRWAQQPPDASVRWCAKRLSAIRCFAKHRRAFDPRTEVPPQDLIPCRTTRRLPHLYTEAEIGVLMRETRRLRPPLMGASYATLLGLLAATGMRVGEALALDDGDVDWSRSLLKVRHAKFQRSRLVLLHRSAVAALREYVAVRDRLCVRLGPWLFTSTVGTRGIP